MGMQHRSATHRHAHPARQGRRAAGGRPDPGRPGIVAHRRHVAAAGPHRQRGGQGANQQVRLARLKGELVDRSQAIAHVFKLARAERDAWLNWPARVSAQMAATLGVDPHTMHVALESGVREHLQELGELRPRVD